MRDNEVMSKRVAIVGGGISGLATAFRLRQLEPEWDVVVLERHEIPGGKVHTTVRDGYTVEWGPNGFLTNVPETLVLARQLGLDRDLLRASNTVEKRYLFRDGALRPLPMDPTGFVGTELVSASGKLRAALEPLLARRHRGDESVHDFIARHFGSDLAVSLAEALVLGITAGDARQLSLDALFPRVRGLEEEHRSLVLALVAARRKGRNGHGAAMAAGDESDALGARSRDATRAAERSGGLASFRGGVAQLIAALQRELAANLQTGKTVKLIRPGKRAGFELALERHQDSDGGTVASRAEETLHADGVVLAVPAYVAASLVAAWRPGAAALLEGIPFAPIRVFGLGYDRIDVPRVLDGFGFLAPAGEGLRSLGVLWSSAVFPAHAPEGKVLLRALCGGVRDPGFMDLDPQTALAAVRDDLRVSMGIVAEPELVEQIDWPRAIPQYLVGHADRLAAIEREFTTPPDDRRAFVLTGSSYRGIGLNDCVRQAHVAAADLITRISEMPDRSAGP